MNDNRRGGSGLTKTYLLRLVPEGNCVIWFKAFQEKFQYTYRNQDLYKMVAFLQMMPPGAFEYIL